jgi:hypothetical protein
MQHVRLTVFRYFHIILVRFQIGTHLLFCIHNTKSLVLKMGIDLANLSQYIHPNYVT